MAEKLLYEVTQNDYERAAVFEREKILTDYYAGLAYAELKGEKQGKIEGILEGKIEGKLEVASAMKVQGFAIEQICRLTGLSMDEVEDL